MKTDSSRQRSNWSSPRRPRPAGLNGTWLRLAMLVALLVFVLWAMREAGKPKNWAWMGFDQPGERAADPNQQLPADQIIEGKLRQPQTDPLDAGDQPGRQVDAPAPVVAEMAGSFDFWQATLVAMEPRQRSELFRILRQLEQQSQIDDGLRSSASDLGKWLDTRRQLYHAQLLQLLGPSAGLTPDEEAQLSQTLFEMQKQWHDEFQPAWQNAVGEGQLDDRSLKLFEQTKALLDQVALVQVKDNTAIGRAIEAPAWINLCDKVAAWSEKEIHAQSVGLVSMAQLLAQPAVFRGRVVTVEGTAVQGQRLAAGSNDLGIEFFYLLWIRPRTVANVPFCVYALQLPQGFPAITERAVELDQPVEVNGFLFKTRVYMSTGGAAECPLILARGPCLSKVATGNGPRSAFSAPIFVAAVVGAGLLGVCVSIVAYRVSFRRRKSLKPQTQVNQELTRLEDDPQVETVQQRLRRLADTDWNAT